MTLQLIIHQSDVFPGAANQDPVGFAHRVAARAVVLDNKGRVALLHVARDNYYKLPGGGVEPDEDLALALERELLEEIGCRAEIVAEIGTVIEYRDEWQMIQTSYCYLARQIGEQGSTALTEYEQERGFKTVWAANIDEAIRLLEGCKPADYGGNFMRRRDEAVLRAAKTLL